jgi:hypothetical protein
MTMASIFLVGLLAVQMKTAIVSLKFGITYSCSSIAMKQV